MESWHERVKSFMIGYKPKDTWREGETACFYKVLSEKTQDKRKKECKGGKKANSIRYFLRRQDKRKKECKGGKKANSIRYFLRRHKIRGRKSAKEGRKPKKGW